jgi:hypothetical protein
VISGRITPGHGGEDLRRAIEAATVAIPERVWDDFLSPSVSSMESELGLTPLRAEPFTRKRGKGAQCVYHNVSAEIRADLGRYLYDRGDLLLGQGVRDPYDPFEKAERDMLRRAMKLGAEIMEKAARP